PEVAGAGPLEHGVAVVSAEKGQRQLALLDVGQVRLYQGRPLAGELPEALLVLAGHLRPRPPGLERRRRDTRLHDYVSPTPRTGELGERGLVTALHPGRGDDLDAGIGEVA